MKCPYCGKEKLKVIKQVDKDTYISRVYECEECRGKVTSVETLRISKKISI